jgi:2-methylcitrate dehydratase PrpD
MGHASAVLVPALLATGEMMAVTGEALIDAYLVGLQAQAVIGTGVNPSHYAVGWHATSTVGCIGAAAGAAWLMGLDEAGIERSMTLATSMASGLKGQFGTAAKPLHAGLAARNAVEAAFLGAAGLTGNPNILEHDHGFRALYSRASNEAWQEATKNLDEPHVIEEVGLAPKRHPCCASTHNTLDMILDLQSAHGFEAADVAAVDALVGRVNQDNLPYTHPSDEMQARFSMNYCVAVALLRGHLRISDFTQEAVHREDVQALLPLTTLRSYSKEDEEQQSHLPHRIRISLRNGTVLEASREMEKGTLADPFDSNDRWSKYSDCCEGHLDTARAREFYDWLSRLEDQPNLRFISETLIAAR